MDVDPTATSHLEPSRGGAAVAEPLVSVVIPAYNAEVYLERTLHSALAQTHRRLEVLVVDDGSTDGTVATVERVAREDSRVSLLRQANRGTAAARNLAIARAQGELVAPLDADDLWEPDNLARQVAALAAAPEAAVAYSWSRDVDENDVPTGGIHVSQAEGRVFAMLLCHNFLGNASSSLIRRRALVELGGYDEGFRDRGCEDWDLHLRLAERHDFRVVSAFLVDYRQHSGAVSKDRRGMAASHAELLARVRVRQPRTPATLLRMSRSSFLVHLAWQSYGGGDVAQAVRWLDEAKRADPVTPRLRPGCWSLALRCAWAARAGRAPHPGSPRPNGRGRAPGSVTPHTRYKLAADRLFDRFVRTLVAVAAK